MVSSVSPSQSAATSDRASPASMCKSVKGAISKKRPLRKVGFCDSASFRVLDKFTEEERSNTWYSANDYAFFGKEVRSTVRVLRKARRRTAECTRGLEKYFSTLIHAEKKRRERTHYQSILGEHQRQKAEGTRNPKILRMLSTIHSKWALQNAQQLAQQDAREAVRIELDDDSLCGNAGRLFNDGFDSDSDSSVTIAPDHDALRRNREADAKKKA